MSVTHIIFLSIEAADALIKSVGATPGGVWCWFDPDAGWYTPDPETGEQVWVEAPNQVLYSIGSDDRIAISYDWSISDLDWLQEYLSEEPGVEFLESLPIDWNAGE